jgi:hypothetical protein
MFRARRIECAAAMGVLLMACSLTSLDGYSSTPTETGTDATAPIDAGTSSYDAPVVTSCPNSTCVSVPPSWEAVAIVSTSSECPPGFTNPTTYVTDATAAALGCSCTCGGSQTCAGNFTVADYPAAGCSGTATQVTWPINDSCQPPKAGNVAGHSSKIIGSSLQVAGQCTGTPQVANTPAATKSSSLKCRPSTLCPTGACLTASSGVCIARSGDTKCPDGYAHRQLIAKDVIDTRKCGPCSCGSTLGCSYTGVDVYNYGDCRSGSAHYVITTACTDFPGGYPTNGSKTLYTTTGSGTCSVTAPSTATGSVTLDPATTETVCCP